ncbi:MAG: hypothetical protein ABIO71_09015 [Caldimonas sp.]
MAFRTTFNSPSKGPIDVYNIDFSVGAARFNLPADVMLVQALFRMVHFELQDKFPPPPGETDIDVNGKLTRATVRFIRNWQGVVEALGFPTFRDDSFDPFRKQRQVSTVRHVRYSFELLNQECFNRHLTAGTVEGFLSLPTRSDIPAQLRRELALPARPVAKQYQ